MVETDNRPEMSVGLANNIQNIMEEYGDTIYFFFFLGILCGILLSYICYKVYKFIKSRTKEKQEIPESEISKTEINIQKAEDDKFETKFIIGFIVIIVLICAIAVGVTIKSSNEDDKQDETPITETRNATNKDIIINVNNMTLSIQASEKIEGLVVKVNYLDKDKNILKTENVNVGNIAPGNTFQHTLTKSGMQVPDLDKLKSVTVEVIDGTIEE